ncbi:TPA: hypothetical protein LR340_002787 [Clostridioides difficile]|uniref:hypothetical protein n=1 Tax=Clostridioides difficile TaxID=1496 RepID=UPI0003B1A71D|nr:hypothetical protein QSW_3647 [Clostridioides difficile P41]MCQ4383114.1 hypothetical protein [Clostridioides difficile]MCQ4436164.1 hypothetical protein [Clostridioides difficile]NJI56184.1 hypothetical protein [Clostridioides difficile]HBG4665852.1 hypothetical protein [Clostridioides difficile]
MRSIISLKSLLNSTLISSGLIAIMFISSSIKSIVPIKSATPRANLNLNNSSLVKYSYFQF